MGQMVKCLNDPTSSNTATKTACHKSNLITVSFISHANPNFKYNKGK